VPNFIAQTILFHLDKVGKPDETKTKNIEEEQKLDKPKTNFIKIKNIEESTIRKRCSARYNEDG
jgi:hypothetical protein